MYSLTHALIDATCVGTLFAIVTKNQLGVDPFLLILLYNALAFSTQPLFGLLVDKFTFQKISTLAGILLVGVSPFLMPFPYLAILLGGLGNALFHIGGGVTVLNLSGGKASMPGIFCRPRGIWSDNRYFAWEEWPFHCLAFYHFALVFSHVGLENT